MNLELSQADLTLMDFLLSKEESETRVAIHHSETKIIKSTSNSIVSILSNFWHE